MIRMFSKKDGACLRKVIKGLKLNCGIYLRCRNLIFKVVTKMTHGHRPKSCHESITCR